MREYGHKSHGLDHHTPRSVLCCIPATCKFAAAAASRDSDKRLKRSTVTILTSTATRETLKSNLQLYWPEVVKPRLCMAIFLNKVGVFFGTIIIRAYVRAYVSLHDHGGGD